MENTTDSIRIHVKADWLELEYEGAPSHIREHVIEVIDYMLKMGQQLPAQTPIERSQAMESDSGLLQPSSSLDLSTSTIATKLSAQTGTDLALAASAKLLLVNGKEKFTRKEILTEMKQATAFFKRTYSNNLSKSLNKLIKSDRLRLTGADVYSISAAEQDSLRAQLH